MYDERVLNANGLAQTYRPTVLGTEENTEENPSAEATRDMVIADKTFIVLNFYTNDRVEFENATTP